MRSSRARSTRLAVAALLCGCSSAEAPAAAELAGRWVGTLDSEPFGLELDQAGSHVTGRAELAGPGPRKEYQVRGFLRGGDLTLSLVPRGGGEAVALSGALESDTLRIRLDGGGYTERHVPLVRSD